jgi:hypothetical protein
MAKEVILECTLLWSSFSYNVSEDNLHTLQFYLHTQRFIVIIIYVI